jgi:DNA polymerase III subunit alpha
VNTSTLPEHRDRKVELPCVITAVARQISKRNGQEWGRITVEDFHGTASVLAFGEVWEKYREILVQDAAVLVRGQVSGRDRDEDDPPIFLDEAIALASSGRRARWGSRSGWPGRERRPDRCGHAGAPPQPGRGAALRGAGRERRERRERRRNGRGRPVRFRSRSLMVTPTAELMTELRELFGPDRVRLVRAQG